METNNRTQYCGVHCGVKNEDIITPILRTKRIKSTLLSSAFPTENLPKSTSTVKKTCLKKIHARNNRLRQRNLSKLCAQPVIGEVSSETIINDEFTGLDSTINIHFYKQHKPPNSKEKCMIENLFGITIT